MLSLEMLPFPAVVRIVVIAVTVAHFAAVVVVGTLIHAVVVLVVGVITVIHIVAAVVVAVVVVVVQLVANCTNFSFPCRPEGVCDRWGTTTGHLRRLAKLHALTLSLHCWRVLLGCKFRMQCNAAVTPSKPECTVM